MSVLLLSSKSAKELPNSRAHRPREDTNVEVIYHMHGHLTVVCWRKRRYKTMGVCKDVGAIMYQLRADPVPSCQEKGDHMVSPWFHDSVAIRMINVWVNDRGVVACIVVVLMEKATKECLIWDILTSPGARGVQDECA